MSAEIAHGKNIAEAGGGSSRAAERRFGVGHGIVWFAAIVLIAAAWPVYTGSVYKPGTGIGYYLGLVGGVMMLLMLLYPVRKHMRLARNWGPLRYWFMLHMIFGIGGPALILFHSTFHVKSLNAGVAATTFIPLLSKVLAAAWAIIARPTTSVVFIGLFPGPSRWRE